ncbi:MAG: hypothetical protein ACREPM_24340 [Gemmatimonadaceae bacterium]
MRLIAVLFLLGTGTADAQRPAVAGTPEADPATATKVTDVIAGWRGGLEISVNGSAWERSLTVGLNKVQCPPSTASPCAAGSAVAVDVRFPPVAAATDLAKAHARLGESSSASGNRYDVRLVKNLSSPLCAPGFETSSAYGNARMAINLGAPGSPLPITCRWTAIVGVLDPSNASRVLVVWSDTVVVQLTSKP